MNETVWLSIGIMSAISVGLAMLMGLPGKSERESYDERQLMERAKGGRIAMLTAVCYLLSLYLGLEFDWLDRSFMMEMTVWGLVLVMVVFNGYVIFRDAYLRRDQSANGEILSGMTMGGIWLFLGSVRDSQLNLPIIISLGHFSRGVLLLIRTAYLMLRERVEDDG